MERSSGKFRAAVIGATGGVGQQIIKLLVKDDRCEEIVALVRKPRKEWNTEEHKDKLRLVELENMDVLTAKKGEFKDWDVYFSWLGSRVGRGKDLFFKVDHNYPWDFASIAADNNAHAFYLVSSVSANARSWNHYLKVKGQTEEDIKKISLKNLCITRPGLLLERNNDERCGEKVASWIPFLGKITCENVAKAMIEHAYQSFEKKDTNESALLDNNALLDWAAKSKL